MRNRQNTERPAEERKEKSKERLRVFALYLILAMVIVLLIWMNKETASNTIGFDNENVYALAEGWTMQYGGKTLQVALPLDSSAEAEEPVTYTRILEAQDSYCNMIMFHSSHQLQDGYVKGSAAKIEYQKFCVFLFLVQSVGNGCGCWLADDPFYFQTCQLPGSLRGLPAFVIKIRGYTDDRLLHGFLKERLRVLLQGTQNKGRQILGRKVSCSQPVLPVTSHIALKDRGSHLRI